MQPRSFIQPSLLNGVLFCLCTTVLCAAPKKNESDHRPGGVGREYQVRTFKGSGDAELRYGWLAPEKAQVGKKYPLVLCLHGRGGNAYAADVLVRDELRAKHPCFIMVPDSPQPAVWASTPAFSRGQQTENLPLAIEALRSLMKSEPVDSSRVYVVGQSMGGVGSWAAVARYPELFAAAVPVCGAWDVAEAPKMAAVPIWAFHGEKDPTVPVKFSRELTEAVKKGGGTVTYTEYPDVGHDSWTAAFSDPKTWDWLFAQRKKP
jgi:predicted peptidase